MRPSDNARLRLHRYLLLTAGVWLMAGGAYSDAQAQPSPSRGGGKPRSAQEEKRRKLLEEMGLEKQREQPPAGGPSTGNAGAAPPPNAQPSGGAPAARAGEPSAQSPTSSAVEAPKAGAKTEGPAAPSFRRGIHPLLLTACGSCHRTGGAAAVTRLNLTGEATADHGIVARLVTVREPAVSALLAKASGQPHAGGAPWPTDSAAYIRVLAWIAKGARLDGGPTGEASSAVASGAAVTTPLPSPPPAPRRKAGELSAAPPANSMPGAPSSAAVAPAAANAAPVAVAAPEATVDEQVATSTGRGPRRPDFARGAHPILMAACATCHRANAPAAMSRFLLGGDAAVDESRARVFVDAAAPARSPLLTKAAGELHGGGAVLAVGDPRHGVLLAWATPPPRGVAATDLPSATDAATTEQVDEPLPPSPSLSSATPAAAPAAMGPHHPPGGIALPLGFMLNGRFDLAYERRGFSGDVFASSAVNGLRSYHHFLFLSRVAAEDPCGVSLEVLTLQFWEVNCRLSRRSAPVSITLAGGRILVPFGADPLYHQSYGGLAGFDQRVLPVIWAQEGVAAHLVYQRGGLVLTDDLFLVRGYALGRPDGVLNLQNDFSPVDDVRLGWGNRLGVAWMGISAWYSTYFNTLGHGRRLLMQALDVTVWRQRALPVVGRFSLGAGLLRADVSGGDGPTGGGSGRDYYHFASYVQLRYHPTEWMFVQYRQGLRSFDNRRGLILDNSRLTNADGSTHNFGVVARHRALTAGVFYFINLEKVDEVRDDLFRVSMSYDF